MDSRAHFFFVEHHPDQKFFVSNEFFLFLLFASFSLFLFLDTGPSPGVNPTLQLKSLDHESTLVYREKRSNKLMNL